MLFLTQTAQELWAELEFSPLGLSDDHTIVENFIATQIEAYLMNLPKWAEIQVCLRVIQMMSYSKQYFFVTQ